MRISSGRSGEMADATDSKSVFGNEVWVQVPSPAAKKNSRHGSAGEFFLAERESVGSFRNAKFDGLLSDLQTFQIPEKGRIGDIHTVFIIQYGRTLGNQRGNCKAHGDSVIQMGMNLSSG